MNRSFFNRMYFSITIYILYISVCHAARESQPVSFEMDYETTYGVSVFVLGDIPQLGGNDPIRAVKLEPYDYPVWRVTVAIPAGRTFTYRFATRSDSAEALADPGNIQFLTDELFGETDPPTVPPPSCGKTVHYHSGWTRALVSVWEENQWRDVPLVVQGPGRTEAEYHYAREHVGEWDEPLKFFFHNGDGQEDRPAGSQYYETTLNGLWVQDGHVFNYVPPESLCPPLLIIHHQFSSSVLGNERDIRVWLPRGYEQNTTRFYPVLYMHDGQNVFTPGGAFGCWYADETSAWLMQMGTMRESIIVGIDNMGEDRIREYCPPCSGGIADQYGEFLIQELSPFINSNYRTLTTRSDTAVIGSSMGGLVSVYLAWEYPDAIGSAAGMSSSFVIFPELIERLLTEPKREVTLYLDSGSGGSAEDGMWGSLTARDALLHNNFVIEDELTHWIDYGAIHNEAAWASRLHVPLLQLLPISQETNPLEPSTDTPTPASSPTATPGRTATPTPTTAPPSPTITPSPNPSSTPASYGMRLFLDDHMLEVGDAFHLFFTLHGAPSIETIFDCYVLLDVYGSYWSWPSWRALEVGLDYQTVAVAPDAEVHEDVLHFVWPQGTGQADGLVFWGVSCHSGSFSIAGQLQSLTFSYNG